MGLTKVAITRPVFILMLMLASVLLGFIAFRSMRVEENPDVEFGAITVTSIYPGAGPDEINTLVSRRLEESISGVNGLREVTSISQEGVSVVVANFEVGTDMNAALNDVRSKVDAEAGGLPDAVEKPTINKFDSGSSPVMTLALRSDTLDNQALRDLADEKLKDRFARLPGVGAVSVSGGDVREIQVQLRKDRLMSYGVGINSVVTALRGASLNVPSGRIVTGERETSVRVLGEFVSPEEIGEMRLDLSDPNNPSAKGQIVKLSELANIVDGSTERRSYSRLDGSDAVILSIQKSKEGNAVEIAAAARAIIPQLESQYGLKMVKTFDQSVIIQESLFDLAFALFFGIFLVTVIVYIFLHNLRGTIIIGIAIPVCLMATFVVLWAMGFTINNMSMLALSLAIGVLVDDAIVVLENIYRHLRMGEDPYTAAINGRGEIGLAAIAITLADVVVFIPIAFMGGIVGQFFRPLGVGFAVAVLLSLFVSFTVTPMLASRWYRKGEDMEHPTGRFATWFENGFTRLAAAYGRQLEWALRHRWFVFISGFVVLIGVFMGIGGSMQPDLASAAKSAMRMVMAAAAIGLLVFLGNLPRGFIKPRFLLFGVLYGLTFPVFAVVGYEYRQWKGSDIFQFQFFPVSDAGQVLASIELPTGSSLATTEQVIKGIERKFKDHPDVKYVVSQVGSKGGGFSAADQGTNVGQVTATLNEKQAILDQIMFWKKHDEELRMRKDTAVAADLLERVGKVPGAIIAISAQGGNGFGSPIQMSFASDDRAVLLATAQKVREGLAGGAIEGVINPVISSKAGKPELRAIPDRARMADSGVTTSEVAGSLRVMYEGDNSTKFRVQGKEYDIRVMMDLADRNNPDIVSTLPVAFRNGNPIFLSQVADLQPGVGVDKIERRNRQEEVRVTTDLLPGYAAGTVQAQINVWMTKENLIPANIKKVELGQADVQARESGYLLGSLLLGLILVYMLLASLYDNLLYPFIIQLSQPQAMTGALLALILTDKTLNIVGFIGIIALVGLVGKNAILLVDYTNTLRERGRPRHEALVEAGPVRLRPIMMTTLAVILGMLPVALAIGRGSEFRETIGITIIGGIALSTVLTLLVIPCSYSIFDDISTSMGRLFFGKKRDEWVREREELIHEETPSPTGP